MRMSFWVTSSCLAVAALAASAVSGQTTSTLAERLANPAPPAFKAPGSFQTNAGRNNPALNFYGGANRFRQPATSIAPQMPAPRAVQTAPLAKPFSGVQQASSLSPYLALDSLETENSLPNYFLFVQPRLEQRRLNRVQQAQYFKVQQQLRAATAGGAITSPNGGIPTTGHSGQFMNVGGYYPMLR